MRPYLKYIKFSLFVLLGAIFIIFQSLGISRPRFSFDSDSLSNPNYINSLISYQSYYPFIHYEKNYIEWASASAIDSFFLKIPQTPRRKLKILHIGDSHIQADIPTGAIRNRMQEMMGYGGRGLVFPYKAAGTHSAYDYKTSCEGKWNYTRNTQKEAVYDMGIIGATINTSDTAASFRFIFREGCIRENFTVLKIYCKQDSLSYDLKMKYGGSSASIHIDCNNPVSGSPYIQINLPKSTDTLEFFVNKTEKKQNFFECYGLMIEGHENNGVLYNSVGINGAGYKSILKQRLFSQQLQELRPDLVVVDLGANDFFAGGYNAAEIEKNLKAIIDMVHGASPGTRIIVSCAQDIYYRRKRDVVECMDFSELTKRVAISENCAYYNYYEVAGGKASMNQWYKRGLAQSDKIHLTTSGYQVRGELFLNALLNSYCKFLMNPGHDSLIAENNIIDTTELKKYFVEDVNIKSEARKVVTQVYHEPEIVTEGDDKIYYTIRSGDNLGSIAQRYDVTVSELQYWNGLSGTKIIAGKTLVIYKKGNGTAPQVKTQQVQTTQQPKPANNNEATQRHSYRKSTYTVKSGDTLWDIAIKFGTTVDAIKKANNLTGSKINIGQVLVIP